MSGYSRQAVFLRVLGAWATLIAFGLGLALLVAELVIDRHGKIALESLFFFPAVFSFCAFIAIVFMGVGVRWVLRHLAKTGEGDDA